MPSPPIAPEPPGPTAAHGRAGADPYWITVEIGPEFASLLDAGRLQRLAAFTLAAEGQAGPTELGITITDDKEIHALNRQYLNHDYPTDVLSFAGGDPVPRAPDEAPEGAEQDTVPATDYVTEGYEGDQEESGATQPEADDLEGSDSDTTGTAVQFVTPPGWPAYLGDVVISYETAAAQAVDYSHSPAAEVDVLLVHGLLHLLGYDDQEPAACARMHARQDALLAAFAGAV